ncbi:unnamed protein product [Amoebophrya sp. A25]|nr:unnamed protein product [Amoebophrya sp. A25]|eukprot:GSA25T00002194001.1
MPENYAMPAQPFGKNQSPEMRLMKKLQHCADARSESTAIIASRFAEREQTKLSIQKNEDVFREALGYSRRHNEDRWRVKLSNSPYLDDLAMGYLVNKEDVTIRSRLEDRKREGLKARRDDADAQIFKRVYAHDLDEEMKALRAEKRELVWKERELQSCRDAEKSDAKIARIRMNKRRQDFERQTAIALRNETTSFGPPAATSRGMRTFGSASQLLELSGSGGLGKNRQKAVARELIERNSVRIRKMLNARLEEEAAALDLEKDRAGSAGGSGDGSVE